LTELVRFESQSGPALVVEVDEDSFGVERIARDDRGLIEASQRLDEALAKARPAIETIVGTLRELAPHEHEIEFGIKLNAEAGVVVAKTVVEGHFTVRMRWSRVPS
jgi:hypothetical protein